MYTKLIVLQNEMPASWCDQINQHAETLPSTQGVSRHNTNLRKCTVRNINQTSPMFRGIFDSMFGIIDKHSGYFNVDTYKKINDNCFQHITYNTGDYLKLHIDSYTKEYYELNPEANIHINNKLSVVVMLSDPSEFTGGDFFYGPQNPAKPWKNIIFGKGTIAIFTSYAFHQVTPILSGTRKTLFFWVQGPQWR